MNNFKKNLKTGKQPKLIGLSSFKDRRGKLSRLFCFKELTRKGFSFFIRQINHVVVNKKGTIKGMHFQVHPFSEDKIVNVIKGKIFDVVIDVRKNSKNFLKYKTFVINSKENKCLLIPKGFAHGFQTLSDDCEIIYCHSNFYKSTKELSINPFDPSINIHWPIKLSNISLKDKKTKFIYNDFKGIVI